MELILTFFPSFKFLPLASDFTQEPGLKKLEDLGIILPAFHPAKALEEVGKKAQSFQQWVQQNKGNEKNLKILFKDAAYFTSDADPSRITSQLKQRISGHGLPDSRSEDSHDPLLFLTFSKMLDKENERIDNELSKL